MRASLKTKNTHAGRHTRARAQLIRMRTHKTVRTQPYTHSHVPQACDRMLQTTWRGGQKHSWIFIALQGPDLQEVLAIAIQLCPWLEKLAGDWRLCTGGRTSLGKNVDRV